MILNHVLFRLYHQHPLLLSEVVIGTVLETF